MTHQQPGEKEKTQTFSHTCTGKDRMLVYKGEVIVLPSHQQPSSAAGTGQWPRRFLSVGTELGFGDLSMMVGVISEIITAQKQSHSEAIRERVNFLRKPFEGCELADHDRSYLAALDDIDALLNDIEV